MNDLLKIIGLTLLVVLAAYIYLHSNTRHEGTFKSLSEPLIGSNKCTWGPSYWCASEENAKECNFDWKECEKYR